MNFINYQDLQYSRESLLYNKLRPTFEDLRGKFKSLSDKSFQQEKQFFNYLSHAIKIDKQRNVSLMLEKLKKRLKIDLNINLFLFQSPVAQALCMPRYGRTAGDDCNELIIMVSQHFFNDLNEPEQFGILGHEVGHLLYGHIHIPARAILESRFDLENIQTLKSDVLKWLICTEISCDVVGFLGCECNQKAFNRGMIKFYTGLKSSMLLDNTNGDSLEKIVSEQVDEISSSIFDTIITTHPLTPLRIQIIQSISNSNLVRSYGQSLPTESLATMRKEFNLLIDNEVQKIYPEIPLKESTSSSRYLLELGAAVALSDGSISPEEIQAIHRIIGHESDERSVFNEIKHRLKTASAEEVVDEFIEKIIGEMTSGNFLKSDIVKIIKHLLIIAASDGKIELCELQVIHKFASEFGISKQEIVYLIEQIGIR